MYTVMTATPGDTTSLPEEQNVREKEGNDWSAIFNPKVERSLDITLVHTLVHERCVVFARCLVH